MAISEQLAQFNEFAAKLAQQEGEDLTIDAVYDKWWRAQHREEDVAAIQEAHQDYLKGDRGEPAEKIIAEFRAERATENGK